MPLKNSRSNCTTTFDKIQKCLAQHGAQKMIFDYNRKGQVEALSFGLEINGTMFGFKLPARLENVSRIMYGGLLCQITESQRDQVYRTAWANIRDWITSQMAMIDTEMVKFEEVFLPYMLDKSGETVFERMESSNFLLTSGK